MLEHDYLYLKSLRDAGLLLWWNDGANWQQLTQLAPNRPHTNEDERETGYADPDFFAQLDRAFTILTTETEAS